MNQIPRKYLDEWLNSVGDSGEVSDLVGVDSSSSVVGDRLVYSSGKEVFLYVDGVDDALIASRSDWVMTLCSHGGVLFDGGLYNAVFDMLNNKLVASHSNWVMALCSHGGVLFDACGYGGVFDTLNNKLVAERSGYVFSLCSHGGVLYDAGGYGGVFDTLNNKRVAERSDWVSALCSHGGVLLDAGDYGIYETSSGKLLVEGKPVHALVSVSGSLADKLLEARL